MATVITPTQRRRTRSTRGCRGNFTPTNTTVATIATRSFLVHSHMLAVVPEDARFAQVSDTNEDTAKEEAELGR